MFTRYGKIIVFALILFTLTGAASGQTQPRRSRVKNDFELSKRFGVGFQVNVLNFGVGPSAEYWVTEKIGVMVSVGALADFKSFGVRGNYLLNRIMDIRGYPAQPYIGVGYTSVKADYGMSITQEGSGLEVYGGLLHPATYLMKNLYLRGEFILSTLTIETSGKTSYGETIKMDTLNWGFFSFGGGITYYF